MADMICADTLLIDRFGYPAAVLFEKIWFLVHRSKSAPDYTSEKDGSVWGYFTYPRLTEMFDRVRPDGTVANAIGSERSVRYAVDNLVADGVMLRRRSQTGFYLAIDFSRLQTIVGNDGFPRYTVCQDFDKAIKSICQDFDKQEPSQHVALSEVRQTESQDFDKAPIYKELESLEESPKEKDLPSDLSPDATPPKISPTRVSRNSPEYKALEAIVQRVIYKGASLDYQGGTLIQYLVIQGATPDTLIKFVNWWKAQYRNADVPRQIQRIAKTDRFQGKFVTRWEEWQIKIKPKPKPTDADKPIAPILPNPSDEERAAMLATLREGRPK